MSAKLTSLTAMEKLKAGHVEVRILFVRFGYVCCEVYVTLAFGRFGSVGCGLDWAII